MDARWVQSEPIVMDEEIVWEAVREQLPQDFVRCVEMTEGISYGEILQLKLPLRRIAKIGHLCEFTLLTRLELNNNLIDKIEGLDSLANLTWLNLSFNSIEKIEGLESLRKLEVLNLTNNSISVIENMDTLEKLTHFHIANNLIGQLDNVLYLRKFVDLFSLILHGNPVSKDDSYKLSIAAHFPKLMSMDSRLIDQDTKKEASIKFQSVIEKIKFDELERANEAKVEAEVKLHRNAFVEFLNGSDLLKNMIKDDPEAESLYSVPGVAPLLEQFEQKMLALFMQIFELGLAEHKRREAEVSSFYSGHMEAMTDCQQKASQILVEFEKQHKKVTAELKQLSDPNLVSVKIDHHHNNIDQLCNSLLALECQLVSQLEDITQIFDVSISDMIDNFAESAQGLFSQCQDLDKDYHEKVTEIAMETLMNATEDDMPKEEEMLFTNETEVRSVLATTHDNHVVKIRDRETQLVTGVNAWKAALVEGIKDKVAKQHDMRLADVHRYAVHLRKQLEESEKNHQELLPQK
ncbi:dynein regulatory complex subunit 3 [Brachionichthys hirsutus]|uniref:dynein regulatory complex subunit 3 n=1 Tax=Brachionichthys hirsutus TaxID=412623 RepID=UPI00360451E9